jgi:hypothetical protein
MAKVVGFCGFISAGKDTAADYLCNYYGFRRDSFANSLKDAVACVFGWDRTLLEGRTTQAREWREQIDPWWSDRLGKSITPRWVLQYWGTDVCRHSFHDDIWIASLENKMRKTTDNIVISDVRFPNEIAAIHDVGGIVVRIKRGIEPEWYDTAVSYNRGPDNNTAWASSRTKLEQYGVHASETSWVGGKIDHVIENNGTVDQLFSQIKSIIKDY